MTHPDKKEIDKAMPLLKAFQQGMCIEWRSRHADDDDDDDDTRPWGPVETWRFLLRLLSDRDPVRIAPDQRRPAVCACGYAVEGAKFGITECDACIKGAP